MTSALSPQITQDDDSFQSVESVAQFEAMDPPSGDEGDQTSTRMQGKSHISESDQSLRNAQLSRNLAGLMFLISLLVVAFLWIYARTKMRANQQLEKLHDELNIKNAEIAALNRRKDHMIASVSHDLRNPLNGIIGVIDTLGCPGVLDDKKMRNELISLATASARQAMQIVENLVNLERIHSGELRLNLEKKQVQPVLKLAVIENKLITDSKAQEVVLDVELSARNASIMCEETAMIQILSNLISNASKYSPAETRIEVSAKVESGSVVISVRDQGPGIEREAIEKLFNPSSRGLNISIGGEKSTGFGLWVVKTLTEAMGGEVGVSSEVGSGSRFWVRLPIQSVDQMDSRTVLVQ